MRKSARTQIPPFFDNDPYTRWHSSTFAKEAIICELVSTRSSLGEGGGGVIRWYEKNTNYALED